MLNTKAGVSETVLVDSGYQSKEIALSSIDIKGKQNRVIIDNYSFLRSERNPMRHGDMPPLGHRVPFSEQPCICGVCKSSPLEEWTLRHGINSTLSDHGKAFAEDERRFWFLPPRLLGFALKDKVWGQFLVDGLEHINVPPDWKGKNPFNDELQLEEGSKEMLMAYVDHHKASNRRNPELGISDVDSKALDIIEGKGQGLVILLHGPPGVGKTLTAETIALATNRPLVTVSVAEIGVEATETERNLTNVFADAARWGAVLLMDEADVFIEVRNLGDLKRNALVSVLLRCLEYYEGKIKRLLSDKATQSRL
jgi:hypothetical protein